jgi:exodeoxyribonuclease X
MTAIVIDTETTGFDEPDVIELAHTEPMLAPIFVDSISASVVRFKPRKAIAYGALATHHIFEDELGSAEPWTGSWLPPAGTEYLIGHHIDYDWKAIGSPDIKRICMLALARRHWPDIDSHNLSAMIYATAPRCDWDELREIMRFAHGAGVDVSLTYRLLKIIVANLGVKTWEQLWQASETARIPLRLTFGKYGPHEAWAKSTGQKGMLCAEVRRSDPGYWSWLMSKCDQVRDDPYLRKALGGAT